MLTWAAYLINISVSSIFQPPKSKRKKTIFLSCRHLCGHRCKYCHQQHANNACNLFVPPRNTHHLLKGCGVCLRVFINDSKQREIELILPHIYGAEKLINGAFLSKALASSCYGTLRRNMQLDEDVFRLKQLPEMWLSQNRAHTSLWLQPDYMHNHINMSTEFTRASPHCTLIVLSLDY